ncbi:hypothetical protein R1flu_005175 [Riccia fluitans]|uniref:Uncharacterized protein n=1 Tax=Riccia fluitans TaxID=41844 RepID=A0ABD1YSY0_9MARC
MILSTPPPPEAPATSAKPSGSYDPLDQVPARPHDRSHGVILATHRAAAPPAGLAAPASGHTEGVGWPPWAAQLLGPWAPAHPLAGPQTPSRAF